MKTSLCMTTCSVARLYSVEHILVDVTPIADNNQLQGFCGHQLLCFPIVEMAAVETMRAVLSARSVLRLGPAMTRKMISPLGTTLVQNAKDDLHLSFQSLTLSPVEMQLSAQFPISANFLNNIKELRA
ncbi:hypothetical protein E2C01_053472 [Portunus trituberculatus]|uniref:Uncharacterized protein n=1 Tax=Portunus trituberculatus TaxID=210409 RepID=A0A5B7GPG4_PORTR|nr:hypothetical protein [Portunus trituberculatus]